MSHPLQALNFQPTSEGIEAEKEGIDSSAKQPITCSLPAPSSPSPSKFNSSMNQLNSQESPERKSIAAAFERAMLPPSFCSSISSSSFTSASASASASDAHSKPQTNNTGMAPSSPSRSRSSPRKSDSPFKKALKAAGNGNGLGLGNGSEVGRRNPLKSNPSSPSRRVRSNASTDPAEIPLPSSPTLRTMMNSSFHLDSDITDQSLDLMAADTSLMNAVANVSMSFADDSKRDSSIKIKPASSSSFRSKTCIPPSSSDERIESNANGSNKSQILSKSPVKPSTTSTASASASLSSKFSFPSRCENHAADNSIANTSTSRFFTDRNNHSGTWNQPNLLEESMDKDLMNGSFGDMYDVSKSGINVGGAPGLKRDEEVEDEIEKKKRTDELKKQLRETIDIQPPAARRQSLAKSLKVESSSENGKGKSKEDGSNKDGNRTARPSLAKSMSMSSRRGRLVTPRPSISGGGRTTPTPFDYQESGSTTPEMKTPMASTKIRNHSASSSTSTLSRSTMTASVRRQTVVGATPMASRPPVSGTAARRQSLMKSTPTSQMLGPSSKAVPRSIIRGQSLIDENVVRTQSSGIVPPTPQNARKSISLDSKTPSTSVTRTSLAPRSSVAGRNPIQNVSSASTSVPSRARSSTTASTTPRKTVGSNSATKFGAGSSISGSVAPRPVASGTSSPKYSPAKSRIGSTPVSSPRKSMAAKALQQQQLQQSQGGRASISGLRPPTSTLSSPVRRFGQTTTTGSSTSPLKKSTVATPSIARRSVPSQPPPPTVPRARFGATASTPSSTPASRLAASRISRQSINNPSSMVKKAESKKKESGAQEGNREDGEGGKVTQLSQSSSSTSISSDSPMDLSELQLEKEIQESKMPAPTSRLPLSKSSNNKPPSRIGVPASSRNSSIPTPASTRVRPPTSISSGFTATRKPAASVSSLGGAPKP